MKNLPLIIIIINTSFVLQKIDQLSINLCVVIKYFKIKKTTTVHSKIAAGLLIKFNNFGPKVMLEF